MAICRVGIPKFGERERDALQIKSCPYPGAAIYAMENPSSSGAIRATPSACVEKVKLR